jgi:Zn-dependent peptidase ImmA (M78 family)/transcriptional regulator with XRE-family HTH domain
MSTLDSIDPLKIGERLRIARSNAGLTQEEAAKAIEISRPTLVAIEQGQRKVRGEELRRLASVLKTSINELLRDTAVHVDLTAKFRRVDSKLKKPAEEAIQLLNRLASASVEIEARLNRKQHVHYPLERPIQPGNLDEQAEDVALDLRHRLGLGLSPVADIVSLIEIELGIRIFFRALYSSISGVFAFDPAIGACMLINSRHPEERQILTILHELGHFLCTRLQPDLVSDEVESAREERFVTLFAVAFLMPAVAIRRKFQEVTSATGKFTPRYLFLIANYFRVSVESLTRRLEALKLLPQGTFDSLRDRGLAIESSKSALGLTSASLLSTPSRLMLMASEAYREGLLSEGQLAEMLMLDRVELREQLDRFESGQIDDAIPFAT